VLMSRAKKLVAEFEDWAVLSTFLPPGWDEQARKLGAIRRARYIKEPATVLRILLLHLACGCSLAETAARASAGGLAHISAVGVFKRLRAAEPWLLWLAQQMRGAAQLPMKVLGRRLRAVDATAVSEPGATGADWKVHYTVNVADLQCDFFELTDIRHGGETFRRVPIVGGDIMMGDRVYATPPGVAHVVDAGGDVLVRLNRGTLPLFDRYGRRMVLLPLLRSLKGNSPHEWAARVQNPHGGWIAGRLIALRQSREAANWQLKRLQREARHKTTPLSEDALEFANYFMVWTTLRSDPETRLILELYRLRWQIELVFKRMKSILGLGHLPKADPLSAKAWLEGKLFVGLLIEHMVDAASSFSPWGYSLATAPAPEPLARG
jgi:Transposase DDE domain